MKPGHNFISADAFLKLKNIIWAFPYLALMGLIWGYLAGASSGAIVGLAVAVAINIWIGSATPILNGPRGGSAMVQKQAASDLNAVRYHKLCHQFDDALLKIENVLDKDPDYVEALLLKAQILWEGFEDCQAARGCLLQILTVEPDEKAVFHRWALNFLNELSEK